MTTVDLCTHPSGELVDMDKRMEVGKTYDVTQRYLFHIHTEHNMECHSITIHNEYTISYFMTHNGMGCYYWQHHCVGRDKQSIVAFKEVSAT